MLLGVQGNGKSLAAKSVAANWDLRLLRLDFATLYSKFYGETEKNLREALAASESMAPAVLWIDEILFVDLPQSETPSAPSPSGPRERAREGRGQGEEERPPTSFRA